VSVADFLLRCIENQQI